MEDTLRYFFSAVFQGFAAIITLGSMFYISYLDRISNMKKNIVDKLAGEITGNKRVSDSKIFENSIVEHIEKAILPTIDKNSKDPEFWIQGTQRFRTLESKEKKLKIQLPSIIRLTFVILIISLISLFLVDCNKSLNSFLFGVGILVIILSIVYFYKLRKIIYSTLELN